jgi:hypothetical protein
MAENRSRFIDGRKACGDNAGAIKAKLHGSSPKMRMKVQ